MYFYKAKKINQIYHRALSLSSFVVVNDLPCELKRRQASLYSGGRPSFGWSRTSMRVTYDCLPTLPQRASALLGSSRVIARPSSAPLMLPACTNIQDGAMTLESYAECVSGHDTKFISSWWKDQRKFLTTLTQTQGFRQTASNKMYSFHIHAHVIIVENCHHQ